MNKVSRAPAKDVAMTQDSDFYSLLLLWHTQESLNEYMASELTVDSIY
jgi:hypothetical protein